MRYWTQTKAPAGNWVDVLGSDDVAACIRYGEYEQTLGKKARVIERTDSLIVEFGWEVSCLTG